MSLSFPKVSLSIFSFEYIRELPLYIDIQVPLRAPRAGFLSTPPSNSSTSLFRLSENSGKANIFSTSKIQRQAAQGVTDERSLMHFHTSSLKLLFLISVFSVAHVAASVGRNNGVPQPEPSDCNSAPAQGAAAVETVNVVPLPASTTGN